jgi:hypothetical protein
MDFGDVALVALIGGGIYWYMNLPEEAFTDTDKFPVTTNPDGTKSQTRTADDGSKVEISMKINQYFRKTSYPKPNADGKYSTADVVITFYDADGKSITAEEWTNGVVLSETGVTPLQTAGGYVGNGGNSSSGQATTMPTPVTQVPNPPPSTSGPQFPGQPGFPGMSGFSPPIPPPPPVPIARVEQPDQPPNPGYIQPSGFPVPPCVSSVFGLPMNLPRSMGGNCTTAR